ncbi:hypothetical protein QOT17_021394 [Balamuthia mandrillaris]
MASSFVPPKLYPTAFIDQAMFVTISEDNHHNDTIAKRTTPSGQHHKQPQPPQHNHHYSQQQHQRDKQKAQYSESDSEEEESEEGEHVFLPVSPKQLAEAHHQQQHVNHNKNEEYVNLFWNPPAELSLYEMRKKLQINCLVGADFEEYELCNGVKWMVCVDRTSASKRAFKTVLKQAAKEDFVFIVHSMFILRLLLFLLLSFLPVSLSLSLSLSPLVSLFLFDVVCFFKVRGVPLYIEGTPYDSEEEEVKLHYTIWREAVLYMHLYKKEIEKSRPDLVPFFFLFHRPFSTTNVYKPLLSLSLSLSLLCSVTRSSFQWRTIPEKWQSKRRKSIASNTSSSANILPKTSPPGRRTCTRSNSPMLLLSFLLMFLLTSLCSRFRAFSSYVSKKASKHGIIVSAV